VVPVQARLRLATFEPRSPSRPCCGPRASGRCGTASNRRAGRRRWRSARLPGVPAPANLGHRLRLRVGPWAQARSLQGPRPNPELAPATPSGPLRTHNTRRTLKVCGLQDGEVGPFGLRLAPPWPPHRSAAHGACPDLRDTPGCEFGRPWGAPEPCPWSMPRAFDDLDGRRDCAAHRVARAGRRPPAARYVPLSSGAGSPRRNRLISSGVRNGSSRAAGRADSGARGRHPQPSARRRTRATTAAPGGQARPDLRMAVFLIPKLAPLTTTPLPVDDSGESGHTHFRRF